MRQINTLFNAYNTLLLLLCIIAMSVFHSALGHAAEPLLKTSEDNDLQFTLLKHSGKWSIRPRGLSRLAHTLRKRTSIDVALNIDATRLDEAKLYKQPLLIWQGDTAPPPLSAAEEGNLREYLRLGGTLWVDLSDALPGSAFDQGMRTLLKHAMPDIRIGRIPSTHVIYKTFYLLERHGGRVSARPYFEGGYLGDRLAVIITSNDIAGALSRDEFGIWTYPVEGGDSAREYSARIGINIAMYALCLNYKEDQVHLPFILKRRK